MDGVEGRHRAVSHSRGDAVLYRRMVVTRFAPSPTGYLHVGHGFAAVNAWRRARQAGGRFLLRLEDIDPARCRPEYAEAILEDLAWLGLDWDGPVRVQSAHLAEYQAVLDGLSARGLVYPCFCTRAAILRGGGGVGLGAARAGRRAAVSRDVQGAVRGGAGGSTGGGGAVCAAAGYGGGAACPGPGLVGCGSRRRARAGWRADPERWGDVVLARKDAPASYHLCVTHDDALQGVTLVTRGRGPEAGNRCAPVAAGADGVAGAAVCASPAAAG